MLLRFIIKSSKYKMVFPLLFTAFLLDLFYLLFSLSTKTVISASPCTLSRTFFVFTTGIGHCSPIAFTVYFCSAILLPPDVCYFSEINIIVADLSDFCNAGYCSLRSQQLGQNPFHITCGDGILPRMSRDFAIIHGKTPRGILPVNSNQRRLLLNQNSFPKKSCRKELNFFEE